MSAVIKTESEYFGDKPRPMTDLEATPLARQYGWRSPIQDWCPLVGPLPPSFNQPSARLPDSAVTRPNSTSAPIPQLVVAGREPRADRIPDATTRLTWGRDKTLPAIPKAVRRQFYGKDKWAQLYSEWMQLPQSIHGRAPRGALKALITKYGFKDRTARAMLSKMKRDRRNGTA